MEWNSNLYDKKHDFVSRYGEELAVLLNPQSGENILDVGCGTGDLAEWIRLKGCRVTGIDNSREMIEAAMQKYPLVDFRIQSAENFSFSKPFDAVFSNATLHWVLEKEKAVQHIHQALKPGGRFVAELGGKGNVRNILTALKNALLNNGFPELAAKDIWYFPSLSEYASLLEHNGFRVTFATLFERETILKEESGIQNWILMFGRSYLEGLESSETEKILRDTEHQLRGTNFRNGQWYADYKRLRIIAVAE